MLGNGSKLSSVTISEWLEWSPKAQLEGFELEGIWDHDDDVMSSLHESKMLLFYAFRNNLAKQTIQMSWGFGSRII